ncbi:MAG TPA: ABC transporter permease, partial [Bryobacteraceae bacterium]|nr:ABC transporter permease [Bryobacteraceae bacterium]
QPQQLTGAMVTANFFQTLGVKPALGRTFLAGEDGIDNPAAASKVAVIAYRLWQDVLGADPNVLGRSILLNGTSYTIVGVMKPDFEFMWRTHRVWVPATINRTNRDYHFLMVIGRLRAPRSHASAEMSALARSLDESYPASNKGWTIQVDDFQEWLINHGFRTRLLLLFAAVGLVLLIACTNIASLLLVRSAARHREIAVRVSLGATRGRLARQLLTESLLLAVSGGILGLALAAALNRIAPSLVPPTAFRTAAPIELNSLVVSFTALISILTGLLFGVAPALAAARLDLQTSLKDSSRGTTADRGRQRFWQAMVTSEVAIALMLLASAGLMIESLMKMYDIQLGFNPTNVLTLRVILPPAKYPPVKALAFHREAIGRISALPGVKSVAMGSDLPLTHYWMEVPFDLEDAPPREQGDRPGVGYTSISANYLSALEIPIERGRGFTEADNESAAPVAIVNQAFAKRYFPNQDPLGRRILLNRPILGKNAFEAPIHPEIVGVIGNYKMSDLNAPPEPILYVPHAQNVWSSIYWFAIRTSMDPAGLTSAVRGVFRDLDKDQPVEQVGSIEQTFADRFAEPRFQTQLMGAFAGIALLLAIVGIYSVNAYAVAQRRNEIGVRMALGATPTQVLKEILAQGMKLTAIGIAIGLAGALAIASLLKSVLVGVSATDPKTLAMVTALLAMVAAVACYLPARNATRIDPAIALRQE